MNETDFELQVDYLNKNFKLKGTEQFVKDLSKQLMTIFKDTPTSVAKDMVPLEHKHYEGKQMELLAEPTPSDYKDPNNKFITTGIYNYDLDEDKFDILTKVPGDGKKPQMINLGLLLCLLYNGPIYRDTVKEQAETWNCYDGKHAATIFKNARQQFIQKRVNDKSGWSITLTKPGEKAAVDLLNEMFDAAS